MNLAREVLWEYGSLGCGVHVNVMRNSISSKDVEI